MSTTFKHTRILAVPIAGIAMVMAGLAAAPAQADPVAPITTVHIQNAASQPISGLTVDAQSGDFTPEDFHETETPGDYEAEALYPGDWTLRVYDDRNVPQPYVDSTEDFTVNENGDGQALSTLAIDLGAVVTGKVTAPSGHALKNVLVTASLSKAQPGDWTNIDDTDAKGAFSVPKLKAATYKFSYLVAYEYKEHALAGTRTLTTGQISPNLNVKNVKVIAWIDGALKGKSTSKKKATLSIKGIGRFFGLTNPGGTVTVKEGKKTLKKNVKVKGGNATISLSKLKKGKHTFTVSYSGSKDVNKGSKKIAVKVK